MEQGFVDGLIRLGVFRDQERVERGMEKGFVNRWILAVFRCLPRGLSKDGKVHGKGGMQIDRF